MLMMLTLLLAAVSGPFGGDSADQNADLRVALHSNAKSIAPGTSVPIAIDVTLAESWHLYHPIILGQNGLPTEITFDTPPGVVVSEVRFPTPHIATQPMGKTELEYLGLDGRFQIAALLTAADSVPVGEPLTITAHVSGLACKVACVPVDAEASLTLPVTAEVGAPDNADLFEEVRAALPNALAEASHLKGSRVIASHSQVPAGGKLEIIAELRVEPKTHMQARNPDIDGIVPARVFVGAPVGGTVDELTQRWPKPHVSQIEGLGTLRDYSGTVVVRQPLQIPAEHPLGPVTLPVLVQYQICTDDGSCYPPEMATSQVSFEVVATDAPAVASAEAASIKDSAPPEITAEPTETMSLAAAVAGLFGALWWLLPSAFLGGFILNFMPCVLPVVSIKVLAFVQQAGESRGRVFKLGLTYAAGILVSFAVLAIVMLQFKLAWGGIMQSVEFVIGMTIFMFVFGLSLFGVFEIVLPGAALQAAETASQREGYAGAFMKGVVTTALATPCTAPFLAPALGTLVQLPGPIMFVGVMTVGLGLAAPYILLSAFPGWLRFVPKPGMWMIAFKQFLGFLLMGTVIWLLFILNSLLTGNQLFGLMVLLLSIAIAAWLYGRVPLGAPARRSLVALASGAAFIVAGWYVGFVWLGAKSKIDWRPWQPGLAEQLAGEGYTVYVDFTAIWCATCQTNKAVVLNTETIASKFDALHVVALEGDFTRRDPRIQEQLNRFGRNGVPLNVVYPAGRPDQPIVLPEVLTTGKVLSALSEAGASQTQEMPVLASH